MSDKRYTDAEFVVIENPRQMPVAWQKKPRRRKPPVDRNSPDYALAPLRWLYFGLLGIGIGFTLLVGLLEWLA